LRIHSKDEGADGAGRELPTIFQNRKDVRLEGLFDFDQGITASLASGVRSAAAAASVAVG